MRRVPVLVGIAALAGVLLGSIVATHNALAIPERPAPQPALAEELGRATDSAWEQTWVKAEDGAALDAWVFTPRAGNGGGAILLHGVGDTRQGFCRTRAFCCGRDMRW